MEILELGGLGIGDVGAERFDDLWLRGGYPRSFLASDDTTSTRWRTNYIRALIARDLPDFGVAGYCGFGRVPPAQLSGVLKEHQQAIAAAG